MQLEQFQDYLQQSHDQLRRLQAKRWEEAIAAYSHAIALNPQSAIVHEYLGNALAAHDQLNEASTAYRRSLQLQS